MCQRAFGVLDWCSTEVEHKNTLRFTNIKTNKNKTSGVMEPLKALLIMRLALVAAKADLA